MRNINQCKRLLAALLFLFSLNLLSAAEGAATRRFGIFIGSNNGGRNRATLRYAVNDAKAVSRIFSGMGGIAVNDTILLIEPTVGEINRQLSSIGNLSAQAKRNSQRTELVFYFSGHSDENGIMLNRERYSYRELRDRITRVEADMRIVILDSCSSGAITRAKGGTKTQPFLFDSSVSAAGYAFLTSSSDDETSQESDTIQSSYFTHSLLAGLRGAADSVGDGRVTLNELYRYAYSETLSKTETSVYGPQHPSYDIQISGAGDVVLTDIKEISASLLISEDISGRISIRDSSDFLVAELTKVASRPIELGLEPGRYRIILQKGDNFYRADITLEENKQARLSMDVFSGIAAAPEGRPRGAERLDEGSVPYHPFSIQFWPGVDIFGHGGEIASNSLLIGLFIANGYSLNGFGMASFGLNNSGHVRGIQLSGIYNIAAGPVNGIQLSGIFNHAGSRVSGIQLSGIFNEAQSQVSGIQISGIFNKAENLRGAQISLMNINKDAKGAMIGLLNISKSETVVPIGIVNIIKNGIMHPAVYVDDLLFTNLSFRSGSRYFYSFLSAGAGGGLLFERGDDLLVYRIGVGFEHSINKLFFNIDASSGSILNLTALRKDHDDSDASTTNIYQLRLLAGYKFLPHLGVFAGISYDYLHRLQETSPDPKDFGLPILLGVGSRHIHKFGFFGGIQF